jgi:hypothetical protein
MKLNTLPCLLLLSSTLFAADSTQTKNAFTFNGNDLSGALQPTGTWSVVSSVALDPANSKGFISTPGTGVLLNSLATKTVDFKTEAEFGDSEIHVEFCVAKNSNSGVYVQGRYEVQILDSYGKAAVGVHDCGAIYERWNDATNKGFEGTPPSANASKPPGEWQSFDITFTAPRFDADGKKTANAKFVKVVHNGTLIHENVEVTGPTRGGGNIEKPTGPLRVQGDHGPVAIRNLRVTPLPAK